MNLAAGSKNNQLMMQRLRLCEEKVCEFRSSMIMTEQKVSVDELSALVVKNCFCTK